MGGEVEQARDPQAFHNSLILCNGPVDANNSHFTPDLTYKMW